ncbi:MAG TPA: hypothetical protein VH087_04935 [Thermoanaerobaculia bacterium]|jgi:tyrosinase|nr:hypothetical protein [Thermoanaerobaculia bacterium]
MATRKPTTKKASKAKPSLPYRPSAIYKAPQKISKEQLPPEFTRADIEFIGIDHSGSSYEARVYLNNPKANAETPPTLENGYAGSYHIFGHGGCFGDVGHCEINRPFDPFDPRPSHPLEPIRKVVIATDAVRQALASSSEIAITVVPLVRGWTENTESDLGNVMSFDHINLVCYD